MQETVNYGLRLRKIRKSKFIRQADLEHSAGLAEGVISRIEKGHTNPSKETLFKIISALNLNLTESIFLIGLHKYICQDYSIESSESSGSNSCSVKAPSSKYLHI